VKGSRHLLLKFCDPSMSRKRLKLETSNLECTQITKGTNEQNEKLGQPGSYRGHVTYFKHFGTPPYHGNGWSQKLETWHAYRSRGALTNKMQNSVKMDRVESCFNGGCDFFKITFYDNCPSIHYCLRHWYLRPAPYTVDCSHNNA